MLINQVVDSKAIALATTNDASNAIPYLGLNWFPEKKKMGLDLKWIKNSKGLPVALAPSNFDALPVLRARNNLAVEKTQMAFFREQMIVSEEDEQEIARIQDANDPYLSAALQSIYDDATNLVEGAEVIPEVMRMSLLATTSGHPMISIASDGVTYSYDYDPDGTYAADHYVALSGTSMWSDTTNSTPLDDLNDGRKVLQRKGKVAKYALMNSNTFEYLLNNAQIQSNILAQNTTAVINVNDDDVIAVVKNRAKLTIVLYDKMYKDQDGTETYFFPDDKVVLLPEGELGSTWFGTTPEERTAIQDANVDVAIYGTGIAVATKVDGGPPAITKVTASEIVLPSYENMFSTYVLEVATA